MAAYELRCEIFGHEKDVRAVFSSINASEAILSGSRDMTSRLWTPNDTDSGFNEAMLMRGHNNFVTTVCMLPGNDKYPDGIIVTGSSDSTILAYSLHSPVAIYQLTGHTDSVCALSAGKFGTLMSGSWDTTARVWLNENSIMTLKGHDAAVWSVAIVPEVGLMLTGSADKTIKIWKAGKCEKTLYGHEDCVRGLAILSKDEFLSCSNDSTVRRWAVTAGCIAIYSSHTNFVYAVISLAGQSSFASCGEDRTLKIWKEGHCVQTISHPCQSVWSVCLLNNGDIVTGSSDGVIRVFTNAKDRMATPEEIMAFKSNVANSAIPQQIGDINIQDLPGPEFLSNPGRHEGQTIMIKRNDNIEAYQWSNMQQNWIKVGDVVGSGSKSNSRKIYEGKEYDYVFDVELHEGQRPLKLPYNTGEDPWLAAQRFLEANELSQLFLDQVANFIQQQTNSVVLGSNQQSLATDPFTGGCRYIPGITAPSATGSDSNTPSVNNKPQYFPEHNYLTFKSDSNVDKILAKLSEFNNNMVESKLNLEELDSLRELLTNKPQQTIVDVFDRLLHWPPEFLFPVLDVLRLALCQTSFLTLYTNEQLIQLVSFLLNQVTTKKSATNMMLSLRCLCNLFQSEQGQHVMRSVAMDLLSAVVSCHQLDKSSQIALASLLVNFSILFVDCRQFAQHLFNTANSCRSQLIDDEAVFRLFVAIGTILSHQRMETDSLNNIKKFIEQATQKEGKLQDCCVELLHLMQTM